MTVPASNIIPLATFARARAAAENPSRTGKPEKPAQPIEKLVQAALDLFGATMPAGPAPEPITPPPAPVTPAPIATPEPAANEALAFTAAQNLPPSRQCANDGTNIEAARAAVIRDADGRDATAKAIRAALKSTGRAWSVTVGTGTARGWITITAPPARRTWKRRPKNGMTPAEANAAGGSERLGSGTGRGGKLNRRN